MNRRTWHVALALAATGALGTAGAARAGEEALPPEAQTVVQEFERLEAEVAQRAEAKMEPIRQAAEAELRPAREAAARKLRGLQDQYTRAGKLDEALALREAVRTVLGIRPDPGALHLQESEVGKSFLYEVRGSTAGSVWGSEVYTADSHLGTAAVHAGLLRPGEVGLVKVRVLGPGKSFRGSVQNGVTSLEYGPWPLSFTVEPARLER